MVLGSVIETMEPTRPARSLPYVHKCFDAFEDKGAWVLVCEYCSGGSLRKLLQRPIPNLCEGWLVASVVIPLLGKWGRFCCSYNCF